MTTRTVNTMTDDPNVVTYMGRIIQQDWRDLAQWEKFFNQHAVKLVIELGTGNGAMSLFLAAQAIRAGAAFHTLDNQCWTDPEHPLGRLLSIHYHHIDLWGAGHDVVKALIENPAAHPVMLFCDDGDKPREWRTFGPYLSAGDYIAVHDWPYEFGAQHIGALPVVPLYGTECEARSGITRWFEIRGAS